MTPGRKTIGAPKRHVTDSGLTAAEISRFRQQLADWYALHARKLPWRGIVDPYRTWVSEIMLQQTRVAAVIDHYDRFLRLFPTVQKLAAAEEFSVLAVWSGLGYYRRARMLHRAAQFIVQELAGEFPTTSTELRTLPGIGEYTSAAIASIAFGESIAVVDGNVERVLLRISGRAEEKSSASRAFVSGLAGELVPPSSSAGDRNDPGDHNQAMMELGATVCLPRAPICMECPVYSLCRTRGEHVTPIRAKQSSRRVGYLLQVRRAGAGVQVLLEQRAASASLMPGMYELPTLPLDAVTGREPLLRLRHSITTTNYYVEIFAEETTDGGALVEALPADPEDLGWHALNRLHELPLTGLARKALQRLNVLAPGGLDTPAERKSQSRLVLPRPTSSIEVRAAERRAAEAAAEFAARAAAELRAKAG